MAESDCTFLGYVTTAIHVTGRNKRFSGSIEGSTLHEIIDRASSEGVQHCQFIFAKAGLL